ncbi:MAG: OmpA family protein [Verrucomicrobiaceae bacterium]|nr:OmpA family protein [Verrucomicrobiaceae bacterium]
MQSKLHRRHHAPRLQAGNSLVPVLIVVSALAISAAIFFMFTRKHMASGEAEAPAAAVPPSSAPSASSDGARAATPPGTKPAPENAPARQTAAAPAPPAPAPQPLPGFARPLDLASQFARSLGSGDIAAAGRLAAAANPSKSDEAAGVLDKIFKGMGYKVGPEEKVELLGQVENFTRLSIPLVKPGDPAATLRMQIDVERDDKMGWKIAKLHLPKELGGALAGLPSTPSASSPPAAATTQTMIGPDGRRVDVPLPPPPGGAPATAVPGMKSGASLFTVAETTDALAFATDFVQTLLKHDFAAARKFIDEQKVPPQKLAGLCIVFEEGGYEFKPAKPLIVTVANPEVSWVIAQVQSEALQQSTEFGLELQRGSPAEEWHVAGLNLSEILGSFAQSATKLGVPYTPLVRNPKGGESLALYFEYDRADLHPRAVKQLEIVAAILKSDTKRKLNIAGHTDAKGADDYNLRLSQARAESVKKGLIGLGVPPGQVSTSGLGKAQPLGPNQKADGSDDPEGRSKNRRAEIFLDF